MPRNFDEERDKRRAERRARWTEEDRDRSFVLGGEVFEYAETIPFSTVELVARGAEAANDAAYIRLIAEALPTMIDAGATDEERAETLERLERAKASVEFLDVEALCYWIMGEFGRRPTQAPSPSGERRESNGDGSTESSSSPPVASAVSPS